MKVIVTARFGLGQRKEYWNIVMFKHRLGQFSAAKLAAIVGLLLVAACSEILRDSQFPVSQDVQSATLGEDVEIVNLDASTIHRFAVGGVAVSTNPPQPPVDTAYLIGVGDVLRVIVWDHPELTSPGSTRDGNGYLGLTVRSDGSIFFPHAGVLVAAGRITSDLAKELTEKLSNIIPDPQVEVLVAEFNSQKALVSGEVANPGPVPLTDVPITLIEAISTRGGASDRADLTRVTLERGGRIHNLNLKAFLEQNDGRQNPYIVQGDIIRMSRQPMMVAYVLGSVGRTQLIDLTDDRVNLTQALTQSGGLAERASDARGVFVFREEGGKTLVAQLDLSVATALLTGAKFNLRPQDVIFVTRAPLAQWNDLISQLLPSVAGLDTLQSAAQ